MTNAIAGSSLRPAHREAIDLSIVMPVFNSGALLVDSVRSILAQTLFALASSEGWELLIVDDDSTDLETLQALALVTTFSTSIRVLPNVRKQGVSGARNTGIFAAQGRWIGFLDSDDLLHPDFHERQRAAFSAQPEARWRGAHFDVGDADAVAINVPLKNRSPRLFGVIADDYLAGRVSRLVAPVDVLLRCGCMQVMAVQVESALLRAMGGFDETLVCAEDYDLWLRLALVEDLHLAPLDAGIYRIRPGSLTKSGRPQYFQEDRMLTRLRRRRDFDPFRDDIDQRLAMVYSSFCFHFRKDRDFATSFCFACRLIVLFPMRVDGWRHLVATALRR